MTALQWAPGRITVDEGATVVDGQYATNDDWNGWLIVRMPLDSALRVLDGLADADPGDVRHQLDDAVLRVSVGTEHTDVYEPDEDGLYALGSRAWCWELAEGGDR